MITPAYSPTATERVLPRLALDFTTASLDPRVTVTRALNTATRVNSSGLVAIVNADLPRFDYDPVTLACKGLLIEESRQNIIPYSNAFSTQWMSAGGSIAANDAISPDGTQNASKLTGARYRAPSLASATRTYSCFAKKFDGNNLFTIRIDAPTSLSAVFDLNAGTVSSTSAGMTATIQSFGNGWYRCTTTLTDAAVNIVLISPDGGGASCYIWEFQAEAGAFATSLIPTNGSALTRNADVVQMTGANFSDWFNQTEGAFVVNHSGTVGAYALAANDGTSNSYYGVVLHNATSIRNVAVASGNYQFTPNSVTSVASANKTSFSYKASGLAAATNGGTVGSTGAVVLPTVNRLYIGSFGGFGFLNGYVRGVNYYPQRLINAENQAFSK